MSQAEIFQDEGLGTDEPSLERTLMSALHDLWRYRLWVILYFVLLAGIVLSYSFSQTPYYRATVKVLVNSGAVENVGERETLKNLSLQSVIITSPQVVDAVIAKMKLKNDPFFETSEDISMTFLALLDIKPDVKAGTLEILFAFPDPQKAAAIANEIADVYVHSTSAKSEGTTQGSLEAVKQQLQSEQTKQDEIRKKLAELVTQHPELTEEAGLQEQVKFLNTELLKTETQIMEKRGVLDDLNSYLKNGESVEMHPYVRSNPNIANKLERIRELELQLVELRQEYREMHPEVNKAKAKLSALQNVLKGDEEKIVEELRGELRSRERTRDEIKSNIQKIQERLQGATPEKTEYRDCLTELAAAEEAILMLNKRTSDFVMQGSLKRSAFDLEILKFATPPKDPFKPNIPKTFLIAMAFGVFSSFGMFYFKHYLNRAIQRPEDVSLLLRRPLVGQIVFMKKKGSSELEFATAASEASLAAMVSLISANSDFLVGKEKGYSALVTSSVTGEGKTLVAYQLAQAFTAKGRKTILIDADFCRGRATRYFEKTGIKVPKKLDGYLTGKTDEKNMIISTRDPLLDFIGSGDERASAPHAFSSPRVGTLIAQLKTSYDIVLFDAPPVLPVNDAVALSQWVDLRLFVINAGKTSQKAIQEALAKMDPSHKALVGIILNQLPHMDRGYDYYKHPEKK